MKETISQLFVKWGMPTNQALINELVELFEHEHDFSGVGYDGYNNYRLCIHCGARLIEE